MTIPIAVRWLGRLEEITERALKGEITASSITFVVKGEETASKLIRNGLRVVGRLHRVEAYEEVRPDAMCGNSCGWEHIEKRCAHLRKPRCALCAEQHRTEHHKCPVEGCMATRGAACVHVIAKCPNCKGPHGARSAQCPNKKEAQEAPKKWKGKAAALSRPPELATHPSTQPSADTTKAKETHSPSPPPESQNSEVEVLEESDAEDSDDDIQMILNGPPLPPPGYTPANDNTDHDEDMMSLGTSSMTPC